MIAWALLIACLAAGTPAAAPAPAPVERVLYELVVERAGSRSQGVSGVLYDEEGRELGPKGPGDVVHTRIGDFRYLGCAYLWSTCGYLRDSGGFAGFGSENDPTVSGATRYRVITVSSREDISFRGELLKGEEPIITDGTSLETPMGVFRQAGGSFAGFRWSGWLPASWSEPPEN